MKNLREAVEQFLEQNQRYLRAAANKTSELAVAPGNNPSDTSELSPAKTEELARPTSRISGTQTKLEQQRQQVRKKRFARYQAVKDLYQQGVGMREVARRLGLGRDTVRRYVRAGEFPEMAQRQTKTPEKLVPYLAYLEQGLPPLSVVDNSKTCRLAIFR
jgi:transposase